MGGGLGHHPAHAGLHEPHAAARGARDLGAAARPEPAAAAARDHLRDQSPLPGRSPEPLSRRRRAPRPAIADRRGRRQARAHGEPGDRRQSRGQRRGGTALGAAQADRAAGLCRAVAGTLPQRHQRRHPAPLRAAEQSGARAVAGRDRGRRVGHRPVAAPGPRSARRRRGVPGPMAPDQAAEQAGARGPHSQPHRRGGRSERRCSTSRSSASTSTSAST